MSSEGYKLFLGLVDVQRRRRVADIIGSDERGLDGLLEVAKDKAFLGGMQFAASFPQVMIQTLTDECQELLEQIRGLEDEQTDADVA